MEAIEYTDTECFEYEIVDNKVTITDYKCYEDNDYAQTGSVTGHHATRAGLAFKWADVSAFSKLKYVEWSCAASTISPVAVFEPVLLEGTTVSRASLCNISEMERLGIGDDCTVEVIKANKKVLS